MSEKILEIGCGSFPASVHPGTTVNRAELFVALDVNADRLNISRGLGNAERAAADSAMLPFVDNAFTHVIMKSVFGEYTMDPKYTGSCTDNTRNGIYEIFRVLKPGGQLVLAEENTPEAPATPPQIGGIMLDAGFKDITIYPCQDTLNRSWRNERTKFWAMEDELKAGSRRYGEPIDSRWGFLMTGRRPEGDIELEKFTAPASLHNIWKANQVRGFDHPDNQTDLIEINLTRAAGEDVDTAKDWIAKYNQISIVTSDDLISLGNHIEAANTTSTPALFCY